MDERTRRPTPEQLSGLDLELDESGENVQGLSVRESEVLERSDGSSESRCEDLPCQGVCCGGRLGYLGLIEGLYTLPSEL